MQWSWADHLVVLGFAVALPIRGWLVYPRQREALRRDAPGVRILLYRRTMSWQWVVTLGALTVWVLSGRSLAALGLGFSPTWTTWPALVVAAGIGVMMITQGRILERDGRARRMLREQVEREAPFLPRDARELGWFVPLAMTAGFCEEVLFRGYLVRYLEAAVGLLPAVPLAAAVFGLAHAYQGRKGIVKTATAGLVASGLWLFGGTLWLPIVMHALVDINGARLYRRALQP